MNIKVLNKHHFKCEPVGSFYIGRGSPLGNPYPVKQYGREACIALYTVWLKQQIDARNEPVIAALEAIGAEVMQTGEAKLLCFCKPLHCHGDHIATVVMNVINAMQAQIDALA